MFSVFGNDGEPDLTFHEFAALRLGSGFAFTRKDPSGASEFSRPRVVDSGAPLSSLLPPGVTAYDFWMYTIDAHWKYRGFSLIGEYYWRHFGRFSGAPMPALNDDGFVLQSGYFVLPESVELVGRWSRITGDSGTLGAARQSSDELGGGVVFYFNGHNAKLTLDISRYNGVPVSSSRMDLRAIRNPALAPQLRRDLLEYERATGLSDTTLFNLPRTLDGLKRTLEARRIIGREREQRVSRAHRVTWLRV